MGCGASAPLGPRRIDLQDEAGVPAWRCATIVSRTKEQAKLQIDGTADLLDAKLPEEFDSASRHAVHPTPATTLSLNVSGRKVILKFILVVSTIIHSIEIFTKDVFLHLI